MESSSEEDRQFRELMNVVANYMVYNNFSDDRICSFFAAGLLVAFNHLGTNPEIFDKLKEKYTSFINYK